MRSSIRSRIPEGQLNYGFKKRPLDQPTIKIQPNIPEEKLFNVNAKVIEFKKPKCDDFESDSEDADADAESDDDDEEDEDKYRIRWDTKKKSLHSYSYSDLGYRESKSRNVKFVNVPISTTPAPAVYRDPSHYGSIINIDQPSFLPAEYCACSHCSRPDLETR